MFLTLDDKNDNTYNSGNKLQNKANKFSKLEVVQIPDHYSSISIFNKSKIFG